MTAPVNIPDHLAERDVVVTQWRSDKGRRFHRVAWGDGEAASIANVPTRTLQHYRTEGLVEPSVVIPKEGVLKPKWCVFDLVRARIIWELGGRKVPKLVMHHVADDLRLLGEAQEHDHDHDHDDDTCRAIPMWDLAENLDTSAVLVAPVDPEFVQRQLAVPPQPGEFRCLVWLDDPGDTEGLDDYVAVLPLRPLYREIAERLDAWWLRMPRSAERKPPWMT